jgi:hypothetical protein
MDSSVQRWSTIEENRVALQNVFQDIPDHAFLSLNHLLSALHRLHDTALDELTDNEWFEELGSHVLRKTALMQLHFRTYHDYRTTRIVNTLTKEVLTETALLALQYV